MEKISLASQAQFAASPNRRFEFNKSGKLFIRAHNEALTVVAMRIHNPDCSPVGTLMVLMIFSFIGCQHDWFVNWYLNRSPELSLFHTEERLSYLGSRVIGTLYSLGDVHLNALFCWFFTQEPFCSKG
ncbi:MAG: hypothetical protein DME98_01445 [Verrucomicrobia bacterium]|nr:MAG: hypothetical protein DME98_01445 [Verrucomicrobiota bacterium]PYJ31637.1 MAG: hypothetical protein DME88_14055 [Verrucomicrobiota bacterium]